MDSVITILMILLPMFVGFLVPKNSNLAKISEKILNGIVFLILLVIGIELALVDDLTQKVGDIALYLVTLIIFTVGSGLITLYVFDRISPCPYTHQKSVSQDKAAISLHGSLLQLICLSVGFLLGKCLPSAWLPPHGSNTVLLMGLLFLVGILLKNSGIRLTEALFNRRGLYISLVFMATVLASGLLFAMIFTDVSWQMGLALVSGFGWYSISGTIITDAYGAVWGGVALLNDLSREILALLFIPYVMRWSSSAAIGLAGVTGLDFTLPILQKSGGNDIIPLVISFGVITNICSPILMVFFSRIAGV